MAPDDASPGPVLPQDGPAAWPALKEAFSATDVAVRVLEADPERSASVVEGTGLAPESVLGAVVANTGGVLVDHGWLRLLGSGGEGLDDLVAASLDRAAVEGWEPGPDGAPGAIVVAFDVLGGRFAINGGALPGEVGEVVYWGPDTLEWAALGAPYDSFPAWAVGGALASFYADLRWPGWEAEVEALSPGEGLVCYPFLFSAEGRDMSLSVRSAVPFGELLDLHDDLARQVGYLPSAPTIRERR